MKGISREEYYVLTVGSGHVCGPVSCPGHVPNYASGFRAACDRVIRRGLASPSQCPYDAELTHWGTNEAGRLACMAYRAVQGVGVPA